MKKTSMFITGLLLSAMAFAQPAHTPPSWLRVSDDITTGEFATMNPQHPKATAEVYLANSNFEFNVKDDPSINFDQVWQSIPGEGYAIGNRVNNPHIEIPEDFVGKFKLMYNEKGLIILCQVNDDDIDSREALEIQWSPYVNIASEFNSITGNFAEEKKWRNWTYARYSTMGAWKATFDMNGLLGAMNLKGDGTIIWSERPAGWDNNILTFNDWSENTIKQIILLPWADCFNGADLGYTFDAAYFEQMVEALSFDIKFYDYDSHDDPFDPSENPDVYYWNSTSNDGYWSNYYSGYAKAVCGTLNLSTDHLQFSELSSSQTFSLSWAHNWKVESNQSWLTVDKSTGEDNATITVTAAANTTSTRTAIITVMGQGAFPKTIMVTQEPGPPVLTVSKTNLDIDAANNSTASFILTSNVSWTVNSDQTWLTLNSTSGIDNEIIIATATANTTSDVRTATITITGNDVSPVTITVNQLPLALTVSATELNLAAAANSSASFDISTECANLNISCDAPWLTISNSGSTNPTVTVTASKNTALETRSAIIIVSAPGALTQEITVTQAAATTGIEDQSNRNITLFPVQVKDILVISILKPLAETNYTIHSVEGKLLMKSDILSDKTEIDMSNLSPGMYIVKIYSQNKVVCTKKIVKQ